MPKLTRSEMRKIDEAFDMGGGYVLNFSDRTMSEFFEDELGVDIDQEKYAINGGSKAKRVRTFIEIEDNPRVVQLLRKLWEHKLSTQTQAERDSLFFKMSETEIPALIEKLESSSTFPFAQTLPQHAAVLNLDTDNRDLKRIQDSADTDPESAITSACATLESVCRSILVELGEELPRNMNISTLYNAVKRHLGLSPGQKDINPLILGDVQKIFSGLQSLIEGIGALRTHGGDAHGREKGFTRIDGRIASLAVNSSITAAIFLIQTWQKNFPSKELHVH